MRENTQKKIDKGKHKDIDRQEENERINQRSMYDKRGIQEKNNHRHLSKSKRVFQIRRTLNFSVLCRL